MMMRASEPPTKEPRLSLEHLAHTGLISFFTIENGVS
jgi:hypothetical protein